MKPSDVHLSSVRDTFFLFRFVPTPFDLTPSPSHRHYTSNAIIYLSVPSEITLPFRISSPPSMVPTILPQPSSLSRSVSFVAFRDFALYRQYKFFVVPSDTPSLRHLLPTYHPVLQSLQSFLSFVQPGSVGNLPKPLGTKRWDRIPLHLLPFGLPFSSHHPCIIGTRFYVFLSHRFRSFPFY